jgi:GNAT superfamily N-acetyltransferase
VTGIDLSDLTAAHADRLVHIDPLLPVPEMPRSDDSTELFGVTLGDTRAIGVATRRVLDPAQQGATWGALRQYRLAVQLAGTDDLDQAVDQLLGDWSARIARFAKPDDPDASAIVCVPSRDTAPVAALLRHGFAPLLVCAVRPGGRPVPPASPDGVRIRPATIDDLDAATALYVELIDHDAPFGTVVRRPSTAANGRELLAEVLGRARTSAWLAERSGVPVGLLAVDYTLDPSWARTVINTPSVGFVASLYVRASERGGGIGSALVAVGHRALDDAGLAMTLLHHTLPNPRSTPFWYSHGYRPLWTYWRRQPAVRVS